MNSSIYLFLNSTQNSIFNSFIVKLVILRFLLNFIHNASVYMFPLTLALNTNDWNQQKNVKNDPQQTPSDSRPQI